MLGYILLMNLAGAVFATGIFFDNPTPTDTDTYQVSKFFTIQYVTSTVALSPQTITETVNPTCTITASSIPVCGEASVGIIFTSGGVMTPPFRPDVTTTENVPIATATATLTNFEDQNRDDNEITTIGNVDVDEDDMKDEESMTTTTTTVPRSRLDLTENEIMEYDYSEVETTTFIGLEEETISNDIPDDILSSISNTDINIKKDEEIMSVTTIDSTEDEEVMSIIAAINLSPQTSVVPIEDVVVMTTSGPGSESSQLTSSTTQQEGLPLSTSYEMATVVLPSCDCPSGRQPRKGDDIITFMTTKTIDVATVTVSGISMHTIQYAGCVPEDAVVTSSCL